MKITGIKAVNLRGFKDTAKIDFSKGINIFIGPNNSGKSTILNSIFSLQKVIFNSTDVTLGKTSGYINLYFEGDHKNYITDGQNVDRIHINISDNSKTLYLKNGTSRTLGMINATEPNNLIYPYLSKRKTIKYEDTINEANANSVFGNFTNLYSKIDRLVTTQFQPGNKHYIRACENILGYQISTIAKGNGKQAVYFVHNLEHIPITSMGEGVANILGLICDLCISENNIFLIEELENDIHPKALKALLNLIIEKSISNQFFISTHSNIVMKQLGGIEDTRIFNITNDLSDPEKPNLFVSKINPISNDPVDRRLILEELGYEFNDFDIWSGWLFLEESSAEILIRDYFIKWYVPNLKNKLRTFSAGSSSQVLPKFEDFNRLFVFLHLEPSYKNKVWVILDSGKDEKLIIEKMKDVYTKSGWNESSFSQFKQHDFENYYPAIFKQEALDVLSVVDKQSKRERKKELLLQVKTWIEKDEIKAKEEFKKSAKEIIEKLKEINKKLNKTIS